MILASLDLTMNTFAHVQIRGKQNLPLAFSADNFCLLRPIKKACTRVCVIYFWLSAVYTHYGPWPIDPVSMGQTVKLWKLICWWVRRRLFFNTNSSLMVQNGISMELFESVFKQFIVVQHFALWPQASYINYIKRTAKFWNSQWCTTRHWLMCCIWKIFKTKVGAMRLWRIFFFFF